MTALKETFQVQGDTIHAVVLRQVSRFRWNAFLWGAGLAFANSFARRESAERWLSRLLQRHFPTLGLKTSFVARPSAHPRHEKRPHLIREPIYRGRR